MSRRIARGMLATALASLALAAAAGPATTKEYKGTVKGEETQSYTVTVEANQTLSVALKASRSSTWFNVTPPGSKDAIWVGSVEGNEKPFRQKLETAGDYRIDVGLDRAAAHRNGKADFTLSVSVN